MGKVIWKSGTFEYPIPAVMVSCGDMEKSNIITVAWTGIIASDPATCYISVRKNRYSYNIIKNTGEFVINLTTRKLAYATDWCGVKTGAKVDKFKEMHLTKENGSFVKCPLIKESPVSIECKVREIKEMGSHDMFIADILSIDADEEYIDEKGRYFNCYTEETFNELINKVEGLKIMKVYKTIDIIYFYTNLLNT